MNCASVQQILGDYLERGLLPIDRASVAEHLRGCAACTREEAAQRALTSALEALPDPRLPSAFTQSVMQHLPEMLPANEGAGHVLRWGIAACAALFAFLSGLALLLSGGNPAVAHEVLDPMAASLRLAGLMLGHAATMTAEFLDTASSTLVATELGTKLAFAALFVMTNAALVAVVSRYRMAAGSAPARRR
jgi:anti-sigma factor RsiW